MIECIQQHPFLSVVIRDAATKNPVFARPRQLDIANHFRLLSLEDLRVPKKSSEDYETLLLRHAAEQLHNDPRFRFVKVDSTPPWALDVLLLLSDDASNHRRVCLSFTYSHSHGDGMSGIAFHRTFYKSLKRSLQNDSSVQQTIIESPQASIPAQADTPLSIPISWSYLLRPLLGTSLPSFLTRILGISGGISGANDRTFDGSKTFIDTKTPEAKATTSIEILRINAQLLRRALRVCKTNDAKMTALLSHLIARAMSISLEASGKGTEIDAANFVSQIPVNLRKALGVPEDTFVNCVGGAYLRHDFDFRASPLISEDSWKCIRSQGQQLAQSASSVQDQPVGLLRYISDFSAWLQGQIGNGRGCSWELSNIGVFNPYGKNTTRPSADHAEGDSSTDVRIGQILFSQPASPNGPPLNFNVTSIKDGGLSIIVSWQFGSLGEMPGQEGESEEQRDRKFVGKVITELNECFEQIGQMA